MTRKNTKAKNFHISRFFTKSAIEAMEEACHTGASDREAYKDAISRRAVLDTLDKMDSVLDEDRTVETYKELLTACYKDLPSVTSVCKQKWIPCNERLPKADEYNGDVAKYYLVQNEYGDMLVARYTHSDYWEQIYQLKPIGDEIVAWMPLPDPYKAEMESEE